MPYILIVEDDPFLGEMYADKLAAADFKTELVIDGQAAWQKLQQEKPDVVLLDIVLPKVDGFSLLRKIKQDEKLNSIAVIILTNLGEKENVEKGLKLGADDYVIKSHFTPSEVVDKIKKLIK